MLPCDLRVTGVVFPGMKNRAAPSCPVVKKKKMPQRLILHNGEQTGTRAKQGYLISDSIVYFR